MVKFLQKSTNAEVEKFANKNSVEVCISEGDYEVGVTTLELVVADNYKEEVWGKFILSSLTPSGAIWRNVFLFSKISPSSKTEV